MKKKIVKRGEKFATFASREELEFQRQNEERRSLGYDPIVIENVDYDGDNIQDSKGNFVGRIDDSSDLRIEDDYYELHQSNENLFEYVESLVKDFLKANWESDDFDENAEDNLRAFFEK